MEIEVTAWKPFERGTLLGFAEVFIPALKLHIGDVGVHKHPTGKRWASLPGKPRLDRDRRLVLTPDGKPEYSKVIWWDGRPVADAFSAKVIAGVEAFEKREGVQ